MRFHVCYTMVVEWYRPLENVMFKGDRHMEDYSKAEMVFLTCFKTR